MIILFAYGYSLWIAHENQDPEKSSKKVYRKSVESKQTLMDKVTVKFLLPLTKIIAPKIPLTDEYQSEFKPKLDRAGVLLTPKEYYARPIAAIILLSPLFVLTCLSGMNALFLILFAIIFFGTAMKFLTEVDERLKKKRLEIERELPGFIRSIIYKLDGDPEGVIKADLVAIFEDYAKVGKSVFLYDVNYLIMDMKAKDLESALRAMDSRMCIPEVSFLCDALIGLTRGEHQGTTLEHLAHDMDLKAISNIDKEIAKRPGKMSRAAIPMFIFTGIAYVYVLITYIAQMYYQIM
jgi:Flp pilus assembly protein TadB